MFWGFFHIIQATAYYKVLLSKYSFIVSQQKSELSVCSSGLTILIFAVKR